MNNYFHTLKSLNNQNEILDYWKLIPTEEKTPNLRLLIQAKLDPYYSYFLDKYDNIDLLLPAGCFADKYEPGSINYDIALFTTPVQKIINNINLSQNENEKPYVVLLNTGAYSPIHIGHLQMMEESKKILEQDYNVVGGYFSPSHDEYVSQKYEGTAQLCADARIALCEAITSDSSWLMVDPWESRYNKYSINFTDVIRRLKDYLKYHIHKNIKIAYVFGSDNAGFTWAFLKDDISVCFERPSYHIQYNTIRKDENINKNNYFIDQKSNTHSSKAIREGQYEYLPDKIKQLYLYYKNNAYPIQTPIYLLRDDRKHIVKSFPQQIESEIIKEMAKAISDLKDNIKFSFKNDCYMQVLTLSLDQQKDFINTLEGNIINLDACTSDHEHISIGVSRLFSLSDGQVIAYKLINRPGMPELKTQINKIKPGHYKIIDDDIASGSTINLISKLFTDDIIVDEYIALSRQSFYDFFDYELSYHFHDIIDFRDFIIGVKDGGLVVELPNGKIGRTPYVWPYVSLTHRAKLPPNSQREFSNNIWNMNLEFFTRLSIPLTIKNMSLEFQNFAEFLQFDPETLITDFCLYHLKKIN